LPVPEPDTMTALELALYALLMAAAGTAIWRSPLLALYLFVAGLAVHNAVMAALYAAGVRGSTLTAITAWKEILLAVALLRVGRDALRARRLPFDVGVADVLALAFAGLTVAYALIPQSALDGSAGHKAVALALRHDLVPVAAYFLGRSLVVTRLDLQRLAATLLGTGALVAGMGLVDVYAVSISWWRTNGVVDYFHRHLGYDYHGTGVRTESNGAVYGLPENFIYNVGGNAPFLRRLVSTFLSPLASGYLFVVALLVATTTVRRRPIAVAAGAVVGAGLLWTFSRSSLVALAAGLVVLAFTRQAPKAVVAAAAVVALAVAWAHVFPKLAPTGRFTKVDVTYQQSLAKGHAGASFSAVNANEPSLHSHWVSLKAGVRTMGEHPQGYGLGNVGQTASRTGTPLKAGESNYTELGVELGVLGAFLWIAWNLAVLAALVRAGRGAAWVAGFAAAFGAVLALAVQTDVIGDPWIAYCIWGLGGALLLRTRPQERLARADAPAVAS
jgi:O-antigen ligase/polysaccharide polymerase Wzy-like membrane protein